MARVLVVDDEPKVLDVMCAAVEAKGHEVLSARTPAEALALGLEHRPQVALLDLNLKAPDLDGIDVFVRLRAQHHDLIGVAVSGHITEAYAARCSAAVFAQFVAKPVRPAMLGALVDELLGERGTVDACVAEPTVSSSRLWSPRPAGDVDGMVGRCAAMRTVFDSIDTAAPLLVPVLIEGETGTGKEGIARSIHSRSGRTGRFVPVLCPSMAPDLLESELFGHERGAFTRATETTRGLVEAARGGTLFLDEVGDLAPRAQARLLRFLQEREVRRVGSTRVETSDARVVAATNANLLDAVRHGRFRDDLYYRLSKIPIHVPPVRTRGRADIEALIEFLLPRAAAEFGRHVPRVSPEALAKLLAHEWPGNVRDMEGCLGRAVLRGGSTIEADDIVFDLPALPDAQRHPLGADGFHFSDAGPDWRPTPYRRRPDDRAILDTLEAAGGNRAETARRLGVDARTVYTWLRQLGNPRHHL
jgi:DNA-binding NtrC family response regulator